MATSSVLYVLNTFFFLFFFNHSKGKRREGEDKGAEVPITGACPFQMLHLKRQSDHPLGSSRTVSSWDVQGRWDVQGAPKAVKATPRT